MFEGLGFIAISYLKGSDIPDPPPPPETNALNAFDSLFVPPMLELLLVAYDGI